MNPKSILASRLVRLVALLVLTLAINVFHPTYGQTTTTNTTLTEPAHIQTFLDVTQRIRCICLPSLPIQGCTYNVCVVSSYLKTFIENRIREGMSGDEIVQRFETGFGSAILSDPVVVHFQNEGNQGMIRSLRDGFGPNIHAKPDSTWINLSLVLIGMGALVGIGYYVAQRKKTRSTAATLPTAKDNEELNELEKKYLSEL